MDLNQRNQISPVDICKLDFILEFQESKKHTILDKIMLSNTYFGFLDLTYFFFKLAFSKIALFKLIQQENARHLHR